MMPLILLQLLELSSGGLVVRVGRGGGGVGPPPPGGRFRLPLAPPAAGPRSSSTSCDAAERLEAAESFRSCSSRALSRVLQRQQVPSSWQALACRLIGEQVERCGAGAWSRCYNQREVRMLKSAQLRQQMEVVSRVLGGGAAAAAGGFARACPVVSRNRLTGANSLMQNRRLAPSSSGMRPREASNPCEDPVSGDRIKLRFLRCAKEVEDSIGDLILSDAISSSSSSSLDDGRRHLAACRAFQYLTGQCHALLKACLAGGGEEEDRLEYHKDSILERLNLPRGAKTRVELALLRQCII